MGVPCDEKQYNHIQSLISNFCEIVLTTNDNLYRENEQNIEHFINDLSSEDISVLNLEGVDSQVKVIVLNEIVKYIKKYTELSATYDFKKPFEFDSAGSYEKLCEHCKEYYQSTHQNNKLPPVLDFTLHYIHDMSDHYRIFGFFYDYSSTVTKIKIIEELKLIVADIAKDETIKKIDSITNKVVEKKVDNSINRKMDKISEKISETSVTILGIFAGIVEITGAAGISRGASNNPAYTANAFSISNQFIKQFAENPYITGVDENKNNPSGMIYNSFTQFSSSRFSKPMEKIKENELSSAKTVKRPSNIPESVIGTLKFRVRDVWMTQKDLIKVVKEHQEKLNQKSNESYKSCTQGHTVYVYTPEDFKKSKDALSYYDGWFKNTISYEKQTCEESIEKDPDNKIPYILQCEENCKKYQKTYSELQENLKAKPSFSQHFDTREDCEKWCRDYLKNAVKTSEETTKICCEPDNGAQGFSYYTKDKEIHGPNASTPDDTTSMGGSNKKYFVSIETRCKGMFDDSSKMNLNQCINELSNNAKAFCRNGNIRICNADGKEIATCYLTKYNNIRIDFKETSTIFNTDARFKEKVRKIQQEMERENQSKATEQNKDAKTSDKGVNSKVSDKNIDADLSR